ncbi:MAG TPA: DNA-binding protein [Polyangiaceae bacterium]|nr:DNA-binding protein [Polyangiaceae bacterium]
MREDILTIKEVAEYLKVTERTLYRLAQEGKIPAFKVGASWRFKRADIDAWIEAQKPGTAKPGGTGEGA